MSNYNCKSLIRSLLLSILAFLVAPILTASAEYTFLGCYGQGSGTKNPHASWNLWSISPYGFESRKQKCLNFCTTGNAADQPRNFNTKEGGFPHRYAAYSAGNWCFCGGEITGSAVAVTGSAGDRCGGSLNVYRRGTGVVQQPPGPVTQPRPPNQPPRVPTVGPGGWEPPFPVGREGAIQLTWQNNGDPDGDLVSFWIEIWWWNAQQNQWVMLTAQWANEGNFTLTTANGLVPNIYYAWRVAAVDTFRLSNPWYVYSVASTFRTVP